MKKTLVLLAFFTLASLGAQSINYGVTGNFHRGSIVGVHDRSIGRYGGAIGAFVQFPLVENDIFNSAWLYLVPQIEYSMQGENAKAEKERYGLQKFHHDYVAAQLYVKYFVSRYGYKTNVFVFGGPRVEFLVNESRKVDPAYDAAYYQFNYDKTLTKTSFGASIGVGMVINDHFEGFVRYDQGVTRVYPDNTFRNTFNRQLAIGLNYLIL